MVAVLWSVSVEEQFYLLAMDKQIWPQNILPLFIALVLMISFIYRVINFKNSYILEYASLSVFNDRYRKSIGLAIFCYQFK